MSSRSKDEKKINYAEPASDVDDTELLEAQGATSAADDDTRPTKRRQVRASASSSPEESRAGHSGGPHKALASGKRADQNRKAQRAFRQRKDKYIKDLELRSQELDIANSLIIQLKEENDRLNEIAKSFHARNEELEEQLARFIGGGTSNHARDRGPSGPGGAQRLDGTQSQASSGSDRGTSNNDASGLNVLVPVPRYDNKAGANGNTALRAHLQSNPDAYYSSARDSGVAGGAEGMLDAGQVFTQAKGLI